MLLNGFLMLLTVLFFLVPEQLLVVAGSAYTTETVTTDSSESQSEFYCLYNSRSQEIIVRYLDSPKEHTGVSFPGALREYHLYYGVIDREFEKHQRNLTRHKHRI